MAHQPESCSNLSLLCITVSVLWSVMMFGDVEIASRCDISLLTPSVIVSIARQVFLSLWLTSYFNLISVRRGEGQSDSRLGGHTCFANAIFRPDLMSYRLIVLALISSMCSRHTCCPSSHKLFIRRLIRSSHNDIIVISFVVCSVARRNSVGQRWRTRLSKKVPFFLAYNDMMQETPILSYRIHLIVVPPSFSSVTSVRFTVLVLVTMSHTRLLGGPQMLIPQGPKIGKI